MDKDDLSLFNSKGIKVLTKFVWPEIQKYILRYQFIVYLLYLFLYCVYAIYLYQYDEAAWASDGGVLERTTHHCVSFLLVLYSAYILWLERYEFKKQRLEYFSNGWNYLDFIPPVFIILIVFFDYMPISITEAIRASAE